MKKYFKDGKEITLPNHIEKDGFMHPMKNASGGVRDDLENFGIAVQEVPDPTPEELALAETTFTRQEIRWAFRALGQEATLDSILDTPVTVDNVQITPRNDWDDAIIILMDNPVVVAALEIANIEEDTIKLKIDEMKRGV